MSRQFENASRSSARPRWLRGTLLCCALFAAGTMSAPAFAGGGGNGNDDDGPTVNTKEGAVRGFTKNGVDTFLGIPYAAPPVGKLRWQPPQPVKHWNEVLDATKFANTCPQVTELGAFAGPSSVSEDCLYLNVFTTGNNGHNGGKKPVLVWIHGGGNVDGESNDYDASKLATGGPNGSETVVVVMNYRMGLFGFLSNTALNSEGHFWGNYGILDQQAVLHWVERNIAAFGGDPTKVALGGQSAGAQDTGANVLSPLATGLFNRAIYESSPLSTLAPASVALTRGNNFAVAANCDPANAACLRNLTAERILQLQGTPNANGPYITGPFVDGQIISDQPQTAWTNGHYNHMPTMGGAVKDEGNFGISITEYFSGPPQVPQTQVQYEAAIHAAYGGNAGPGGTPPAYPPGTADLVLHQYPFDSYGGTTTNTQGPYDRVTTDPGKCRGLHVLKLWAGAIPAYGYDFTYQNAPYYFPKMSGFIAHAAHTIDIPFLFVGWHGGQLGVNLDQSTGRPREIGGQEITLSDQLVAAWTNFAKTGNPNGSGNAPWKQMTPSSHTFLQEDIPSLSTESETDFRNAYKCDFWDGILVYLPS